ncbi:MAG: hypothetical protein KJ579_07310, partial [Verrucomicrobia bacterium]|nr:hypothetical protein [Verrucomicrobiota bacterium]
MSLCVLSRRATLTTLTTVAAVVEALGVHSPSKPSVIQAEDTEGWVGFRHLFDAPLTSANAIIGQHLRATLLQSVRKIPPSLLKAEIGRQTAIRLEQTGKEFLGRKERAEIHEDVSRRLLPTMPPTLKACPVLMPGGPLTMVLAGATSLGQIDHLCFQWLHATGERLTHQTVESLMEGAGVPVRQIVPEPIHFEFIPQTQGVALHLTN